ncbi:MAG: hypothetical protein HQL51_08940 [Magnetococcales bacterium]|nr:hypothetical protein [Magnetococcales bacterium]
MKSLIPIVLCSAALGGCSVVAVTDAVIDVAATTVKVGAKVVETTVDLASSGLKAAKGDPEADKKTASGGENVATADHATMSKPVPPPSPESGGVQSASSEPPAPPENPGSTP